MVIMATSSIGQSDAISAGIDIKFDKSEAFLAKRMNNFAQKLHILISSIDDKENVIFSPFSIHSALSMLSVGVKPGSLAEEALFNVLGYSKNEADKQEAHDVYGNIMEYFKRVSLKSKEIGDKANKSNDDLTSFEPISRLPILDFWTMGVVNEIKLKDKFKNILQTKYNTTINKIANKLDASKLASDINKWGQDAGFGGDIVQADDLLVENPQNLILMSAVKIQGWWLKTMDEFDHDELFYNFGDKNQLVKGKVLSCSDCPRSTKYAIFSKNPANQDLKKAEQADEQLDKLEFRMAEIPLIGDMTFTIIEPLDNNATNNLNKLANLERQLLANSTNNESNLLDKAFEKMSLRTEKFTRLQFPKFKYENSIDLMDVLKKTNLDILLTRDADLTEISGERMCISKAKHQAVIEVDKSGLKGGALTRLEIRLMSAFYREKPFEFLVKNPFLFVIRYRSLTLFMGHVVKI